MRRLIYATILCLLCLMVLLPANTRAQDSSQSSDAPYLYYFSSDIDAVVIERADGTDTRVLGAGLSEGVTQHSRVEKHGWSPSGKWLAWVSKYSIVPLSDGGEEVPHIISVDGKRAFPFAVHYSLIDMVWSPTEDVLLMWGNASDTSYGWPYGRKAETFLMAYDFSANKYLFKFNHLQKTFPDLDPIYSMYDLVISWSTSGEHIFIEGKGDGYHSRDFVVVSRDGQFLHSLKDVDAVPVDTAIRYPNTRSGTKVAFFNQDRGLVITDLVSREYFVLEGINNKPKLFVFSPDDRRAILVESGLWLWSENGLTHLSGEEDFIYSYYQHEEAEYWSADSRFALINGITEGRNTAPWIIDAEQQQAQPITHIDYEIQTWHYPNWYWIDTHRVLLPGAVGPTQNGEYGFELRQPGLVVELSSLETETIDFGTAWSNPATFNNDLSILATIYDGPAIHHRKTGETMCLRPHPDSYPSRPSGEIEMDDSGQWILSKEEGGGWAGGGASQIGYVGVTQSDGTHRRDVTGLHRFAEWLPAQVNVEDLPPPLDFSILPEPEQIIHTPNWITHISWSPDQQYLATIHNLAHYSSEAFSVWDFSQETLTLGGTFAADPIEFYGHYINWQLSEDKKFTLVLDTLGSIPPWSDFQILAISEDRSLVLAETQGEHPVYNLERGEKVSDTKCYPPLFPRLGDSFSPNNRLLACSTGIYRVATGEKLADIPTNGTAFAFSPDGTQLAVAASWDVLIYDVADLLEWKSARHNFAAYSQ